MLGTNEEAKQAVSLVTLGFGVVASAFIITIKFSTKETANNIANSVDLLTCTYYVRSSLNHPITNAKCEMLGAHSTSDAKFLRFSHRSSYRSLAQPIDNDSTTPNQELKLVLKRQDGESRPFSIPHAARRVSRQTYTRRSVFAPSRASTVVCTF